jgi:hypothetical protein
MLYPTQFGAHHIKLYMTTHTSGAPCQNSCYVSTAIRHGILSPISNLQLQLIYDRQSVGQSVLVSGAHLGPVTNFSFSLKFPLDSCGFVIL